MFQAHSSEFQLLQLDFSIVLGHQLEVSLLMSACRALIWSLGALMDVSAVSASPGHFGIFLEDLALFYILEEGPVSVLMALFHLADISELLGDFLEALFVCCGGKLGIHLGVLELFSLGRLHEVGLGIPDHASRE